MPAASMKISTAKCPGLPLPPLLKLRGLVLPAATSSLRVLICVPGAVPTSKPEDAMINTGLRSLALNGIVL